jgi:uncharacterized membrane protein YeaQ/YmgE (transglycosylase-associated protein family)
MKPRAGCRPRLRKGLVGDGFEHSLIILIGFIAGFVARLLAPGPNNPGGFILTTIIGVAGAFLATFIGQAVGWYRLDQGAGLIGATVGAVVQALVRAVGCEAPKQDARGIILRRRSLHSGSLCLLSHSQRAWSAPRFLGFPRGLCG